VAWISLLPSVRTVRIVSLLLQTVKVCGYWTTQVPQFLNFEFFEMQFTDCYEWFIQTETLGSQSVTVHVYWTTLQYTSISHEKLSTFFKDLWNLWSAKKIDQNRFWLIFSLQLESKYHRSLLLIRGLDITVGILPRKDIFCHDFISCAVTTFWAMSLVGIYPGRASL